MVAAHHPLASSRFSSSCSSPFFVIHRTNYARLLAIPRPERKHALAVFAVLSAHADGATGETYPSYRTIADEAGVGRSTAIKAVHTLAEYGLLTITHRHDADGDHAANLYCLVVVPAVSIAEGGDSRDERGVVLGATTIEKQKEKDVKRPLVVDSRITPLTNIQQDKEWDTQTPSGSDDDWTMPLAKNLRQQMRDKASLRATAGRLRNLRNQVGVTRDGFLAAVYEARARTLKCGGSMAYFFAVFEDVITTPDHPIPTLRSAKTSQLPATLPSPCPDSPPHASPISISSVSLPADASLAESWAALRILNIPNAAVFRRQFGLLPAQVPGGLNDVWAKVRYAEDRLAAAQ